MFQVLAYQVADSIDIRALKGVFKAPLHFSDTDELFYHTGDHEFIYVFKYGVICFLNYDTIRVSGFMQLIAPFCRNRFQDNLTEEFLIETGKEENRIGYNKIELVNAETEVLRIIMLNVSQSVALDYYFQLTSRLMEETNHHTQILEKRGRLNISGKNLKKYIAKTLILKNRIAENLYIFDSPDETWENESLNKIDQELKRTFDLQDRFRHISEGLQIVKENLELFKDILQYRNSNILEWIIILLILVEVINLFVEKLTG